MLHQRQALMVLHHPNKAMAEADMAHLLLEVTEAPMANPLLVDHHLELTLNYGIGSSLAMQTAAARFPQKNSVER